MWLVVVVVLVVLFWFRLCTRYEWSNRPVVARTFGKAPEWDATRETGRPIAVKQAHMT